MDEKKQWSEDEPIVAKILKGENRYAQEVTITRVSGRCPYGHTEGETFKVTALNSDGLCGSLYKAIHTSLSTLHYGGSILWEPHPDVFTAVCPENGMVQVSVRRFEQSKPRRLKTRPPFKDMTGKGFPSLDRYRIMVEVLDIADDATGVIERATALRWIHSMSAAPAGSSTRSSTPLFPPCCRGRPLHGQDRNTA